LRTPCLGILVDFFGASAKLLQVPKQSSIMPEPLNIDLEASLSNGIEVFWRDGIALFRDNLKGRFDSIGIIDVHQGAGEIAPNGLFDIMGDDSARGMALRPEPDEGQAVNVQGLHGKSEQLFKQPVHAAIHRPYRESNRLPSSQRDLLEMFSQRN